MVLVVAAIHAAAANSHDVAAPVVAAAPVAVERFVLHAFSDENLTSFSKRRTCDSMCRDKVDRPCDPADALPM